MALVTAQVMALDLSSVPFEACGSYAFHATGNLDSPHRVFEFCIPVEESTVAVQGTAPTSSVQVGSYLFCCDFDVQQLDEQGAKLHL